MRIILINLKLFLWIVLSCVPVQAATVPQIASGAGRELDRQIVERLSLGESPAHGISLIISTPADINNLEEAAPLARQIQEELARWFVQAGYDVQEIRKGGELLFDHEQGELLLTRRPDLIQTENPDSTAILVGTYIVSSKHVRFNIRILQTNSLQVLAMSAITIPITSEISSLLKTPGYNDSAPIEPSVHTRLP